MKYVSCGFNLPVHSKSLSVKDNRIGVVFFFFFFFECYLPFFPLMDYNPLPSLSLFFCKERGLIWQSVCGKGELVILVCDGN